MNALKNRNELGELITVEQASKASNLGMTTVRRLASKAGAVRKIGKAYRINRKIFFEFILISSWVHRGVIINNVGFHAMIIRMQQLDDFI